MCRWWHAGDLQQAQVGDIRSQPALDRVGQQRLDHGGTLRCPQGHGQHVFVAAAVVADSTALGTFRGVRAAPLLLVLATAKSSSDRRHHMAFELRALAGGSHVLGTLAVADDRRAARWHQSECALVDAGLDAAAVAAAVIVNSAGGSTRGSDRGAGYRYRRPLRGRTATRWPMAAFWQLRPTAPRGRRRRSLCIRGLLRWPPN